MKPYAIVFIVLFTFLNCTNPNTKRTELIDFAPKNSSIIIKTSNFESLKNAISNNHFLKKISNSKTYLSLEETLKNTSILKPSTAALICFSKDKNDSLQYTFITKQDAALFKTDSLKNYTQETLTYKNKTIVKSTLNNKIFYSSIIDSVFFTSSSKNIIDDVFNKFETNINLKKIYSTLNDNKTCSVIIKPDTSFVDNNVFLEPKLNLKTFTNYLAFDVDASQNEIIINGIAKATDSLNSTINIFKGTIAQENKTHTITPANSDGFMSVTFDDFKKFETNLITYNKKDSTHTTTNLLKDIIEFGVIYEGENQAIVLNSIDNIATKDALSNNKKNVETYREVTIYEFDDPLLFSKHLHPFISFNKANLYCVIDTFFVFAETTEMLHNIIASYQNKTTLNNRDYFNNTKTHLSDEASVLMVFNPLAFNNILKSHINVDNLNVNDYKATALQFVYDANFAHVNGVIKKNKTNAVQNTVSEELNISLNKAILNTPQFVVNHLTKEKEIVVQDVDNNLYLISNKGKIIWKKQLSGPVLGTINQIDIYKNGRLQLCFATPKNVYVIDRNGNNVAPFPMKFNDAITQPLSVFDYDKKKNYRLLVTQGKNILMYNVKAQIVNGFTFKSANGSIINQPKHFRIGSKDYISFKTQNKLYILDRTGKHRVTPKTNTSYSNQSIYLYKNTFTTTTNTGNLLSVKTNGNVNMQNINLNENHYLTTTSKTLVTLTENKLHIKNKTTELDFGNYTAPNIFYINDKIYVTVTDTQSHKVYIFDSQSKLLPNFPVYGNSKIILDNIDKDSALEFVTKGDANAIIVYQIN